MNPQDEQPLQEEAADHLWRAITALQGMTDRLLAQHGRTARGRDADAHGLLSPPPARGSCPGAAVRRWCWRSRSARPA